MEGVTNVCETYVVEEPLSEVSSFRVVFGSEEMRQKFIQFLNTIFYQLDDQKTLDIMDEILRDPEKSEEEIYKELVSRVDEMRKPFPKPLYQLKALSVLQKGMRNQVAKLMEGFHSKEFHTYLEIYFRRYLYAIKKAARMPFDKKIFYMSDKPYSGSLIEKIEADSLFSSYPYQDYIPLNEEGCIQPEREIEKTYQPIEDKYVSDKSLDLVSCLGGLHHIPKSKINSFMESVFEKMKPGGVFLLRDHDISDPKTHAIASVVHSFVNAEGRTPWEIEKGEVREFKRAEDWIKFMNSHHFTPVFSAQLILEGDPTQNAMMAFTRNPTNLEEMKEATKYRKDCARPIDGTKATWIEWGNVRYSKQFAHFIQERPAYEFDYIGHLKQHWTHFTKYFQEAKKDLSVKEILFSDNFQMNVLILVSTVAECLFSPIQSFPSRLIHLFRDNHQESCFTDLEKHKQVFANRYIEFIDKTPFYLFPYTDQIREMWKTVWDSEEKMWIKGVSAFDASISTIGLAAKALFSIPIKKSCMKKGQYIEPETVSILVHDRFHGLKEGKEVYQTADNHRLITVPRYLSFTELCKNLTNSDVRLVQIGGHDKITVDVIEDREEGVSCLSLNRDQSRLIYQLDKLQDPNNKRYSTYEVDVSYLQEFIKNIGSDKIEYIHE